MPERQGSVRTIPGAASIAGARPKKRGADRLPVLTSVRGLAAWWVVLFHFKHYLVPYLPAWSLGVLFRGDMAVDVFFCLSGFVIYVNYYQLAFERASIARFYVKRLARVYPLHLLFLGGYGALALVVLKFSSSQSVDTARYGLVSLLANLVLMQDWGFTPALTWNVPGWSISAEFSAYLAFPFLLKALNGRRAGAVRLALGAAAGLVAVGAAFTAAHSELGGNITQLGVIRCVGQFTVGMTIGEVYSRRTPRMVRYAWILVAVGVALFASCLWFGLPTALVIPGACASLICGLALEQSGFTTVLAAKPLVWVGEISYATYICHYFVYDVFKLAVVDTNMSAPLVWVLAALLAIAILSAVLYRYVERPCQAWIVKWVLERKTGEGAHRRYAKAGSGVHDPV